MWGALCADLHRARSQQKMASGHSALCCNPVSIQLLTLRSELSIHLYHSQPFCSPQKNRKATHLSEPTIYGYIDTPGPYTTGSTRHRSKCDAWCYILHYAGALELRIPGLLTVRCKYHTIAFYSSVLHTSSWVPVRTNMAQVLLYECSIYLTVQ